MMLKSPDLSVAMEPHVPTVISCLECKVQYFDDGSFILMSAASKFLVNYRHLVVAHMKDIVTTFLAWTPEKHARKDIESFQILVQKKPQSAYILFMRKHDSFFCFLIALRPSRLRVL